MMHQLDTLGMQARADSWIAGGMADALLDNMKKAMMLPCSHVLEILPKIARDLSRQGSKEVVVAIDGKEIEIDKRILEEMKDPFIHILRNSIDHGIETPAERERAGKPRAGKDRGFHFAKRREEDRGFRFRRRAGNRCRESEGNSGQGRDPVSRGGRIPDG